MGNGTEEDCTDEREPCYGCAGDPEYHSDMVIVRLKEALNDYIHEFCIREGDEDCCIPAAGQPDPEVFLAMTFLKTLEEIK